MFSLSLKTHMERKLILSKENDFFLKAKTNYIIRDTTDIILNIIIYE